MCRTTAVSLHINAIACVSDYIYPFDCIISIDVGSGYSADKESTAELNKNLRLLAFGRLFLQQRFGPLYPPHNSLLSAASLRDQFAQLAIIAYRIALCSPLKILAMVPRVGLAQPSDPTKVKSAVEPDESTR